MEEIIRYLILGSLAAIAWRNVGKRQDKTRGINHVAAQISTGYLPKKVAGTIASAKLLRLTI